MQSAVRFVDPLYRGEIATFIREAVLKLTDYEIVADPNVQRLVEVDRRAELIKVQPGQPLRDFQTLADRATLFVVGGAAWAPEFTRSRPRLQAVPAIPDLTRFKPVQPGESATCPACLRAVGA